MSYSERLSILDEAIEDQDLRSVLSPVAAVTFGVIPIGRRSDSMLVACSETWNSDCRPFVERAVGMPVETVPYRDSVIKHYVLKGYLHDRPVNHNTFPDPDFIHRLDNFDLLTTDKVDHVGQIGSQLPPDQVVLLDVTFISQLHKLDGPPARGHIICGPLDAPFRVHGAGALVHADAIEDDTAIILRTDLFYDADEHSGDDTFHAIHAEHIGSLPYLIHPTEIQITHAAADGSLTFYIYDHVETLRQGQTAEWSVRYFFLSMGHRHGRDLTLRVHDLRALPRDHIELTDRPIEWTPDDLDRWFRLEEGRM